MRRRPFFGEAIQVSGSAWLDADDPLAQSTIPDPATPEQAVPDRDFDRYLSHDGERQPDLRADLFAGYAYRAPDQRGDATSPMILAPAAAAEASLTRPGVDDLGRLVLRERDRVARLARLLSLSASGSGVSSRLELAVVVRIIDRIRGIGVIEGRRVEPWARSSPCRGRPRSK